MKLADAAAYSSPEAIILVGGLAIDGEFIFKPSKYCMEENFLVNFKKKVKLLPSDTNVGNTAVMGASALIWKAQDTHTKQRQQIITSSS